MTVGVTRPPGWRAEKNTDLSRSPTKSKKKLESCARNPTGSLAPQLLAQPQPNPDQLAEVDASRNAHPVEHVHDIFAGDVAGRAFRVRTAAGAGYRAVDDGDAFF